MFVIKYKPNIESAANDLICYPNDACPKKFNTVDSALKFQKELQKKNSNFFSRVEPEKRSEQLKLPDSPRQKNVITTSKTYKKFTSI